MIVKSIGQRSSGVFGRLLEYITWPDAAIKDAKGNPILLRHNIQGTSLDELERSFMANEATRMNAPKNRLLAYHDILSFSKLDREHLNVRVFEDLTRAYLSQRAATGMAAAAYHTDTQHYHIHILLGSTELATGKALRMSRDEFATVKENIQLYQQEHYPQLASVVQHGKGGEHVGADEYCVKEKAGKSRKDEIKEILSTAFEHSYSKEQFYANAKEAGLELYERNGVVGVADNRNYRLSTLGYSEEKTKELDQHESRIEQLHKN